jgi:hypothetical protein
MIMPELLPSDRTFKVWEYQVSHGQLLVRSPKAPASASSPERTTNLDIAFNGVEYMALPQIMRGAELVFAEPAELESLTKIVGRPLSIDCVMVFRSGSQRFPVVAASVSVSENDWDIFESPFQFRSQFRNSLPPAPDS